jgi:hypothetical protein
MSHPHHILGGRIDALENLLLNEDMVWPDIVSSDLLPEYKKCIEKCIERDYDRSEWLDLDMVLRRAEHHLIHAMTGYMFQIQSASGNPNSLAQADHYDCVEQIESDISHLEEIAGALEENVHDFEYLSIVQQAVNSAALYSYWLESRVQTQPLVKRLRDKTERLAAKYDLTIVHEGISSVRVIQHVAVMDANEDILVGLSLKAGKGAWFNFNYIDQYLKIMFGPDQGLIRVSWGMRDRDFRLGSGAHQKLAMYEFDPLTNRVHIGPKPFFVGPKFWHLYE